MTVQRNLADEVAKPEVDFRLHVVFQPENVFSTLGNQSRVLWCLAIDQEGLEFFEMHVDRVLPPTGVVLEDPLLHAVALNSEADVVAITNELTVDLPLTVAPFEPERPRDALRIRRV